jgi:hypothetical protein
MRAALFGVIFCLALSLTGCATITRGTTQTVVVETPGVTGATCTLSSSAVGLQTVVTPGSVNLQKGRDNVSVRCTKECYQDGISVINSSVEGMTAGNLIFGGLVGVGVDAASGAMNDYTPQVQVAMAPAAGCRPGGLLPPPPPKRT